MDDSLLEFTIEKVLERSLARLNRQSSYEMYLDYIRSEWYSSVSDLILALEDGKAWSDLKLPGRLKLEIKSELLSIQTILKQRNGQCSSQGFAKAVPTASRCSWIRCFSSEHGEYFYYNSETGESSWEPPEGITDIADDPSAAATSANPSTIEGSGSVAATGGSADMSGKLSHEAISGKSSDETPNSTGSTGIQQQTLSPYPTIPELQGQQNSLLGIALGADATTTSPTSAIAVADPVTAVAIAVGLVHSDEDAAYATRRYDSTDDLALRRSSMTSISTVESMDNMGLGGDDIDDDMVPDPDMVRRLTEMGFQSDAVIKALKFTENNITAAASYLLANRSTSRSRPPPSTAPPRRSTSAASDLLRRLGMPGTSNASAPPPPPYNQHFH